MNKIKATSTVNDTIQNTVEPEEKRVVADIQSTKLKSLLNSLKK
jgi:hypothetical protein